MQECNGSESKNPRILGKIKQETRQSKFLVGGSRGFDGVQVARIEPRTF
jgi:hypothetical protein